jgi:hypothetical protein
MPFGLLAGTTITGTFRTKRLGSPWMRLAFLALSICTVSAEA